MEVFRTAPIVVVFVFTVAGIDDTGEKLVSTLVALSYEFNFQLMQGVITNYYNIFQMLISIPKTD